MDQELGLVRKNLFVFLTTIILVGIGFMFAMYSPYGDRPFAEAVSCTFNSDCIPAERCDGGQCVFDKSGNPQPDRSISPSPSPGIIVQPVEPPWLTYDYITDQSITWIVVDNSENESGFEIGYFSGDEFVNLNGFSEAPGSGNTLYWEEAGLECGTSYTRWATALDAEGGRYVSQELTLMTNECSTPQPTGGAEGTSCEGHENCFYIDLLTLEFLSFNAGGWETGVSGPIVINPVTGKETYVEVLSCSGTVSGEGSCTWRATSAEDGTWYTTPNGYLGSCGGGYCSIDFNGYTPTGQYYYGSARFVVVPDCDSAGYCGVIF